MIEIIFNGAIWGLLAFLFTTKMIADGEVFGFYGTFIRKLEKKNSFLEYITKPLGNCLECTAGQISLWVSIYIYGFEPVVIIQSVTISMFISRLCELKIY